MNEPFLSFFLYCDVDDQNMRSYFSISYLTAQIKTFFSQPLLKRSRWHVKGVFHFLGGFFHWCDAFEFSLDD